MAWAAYHARGTVSAASWETLKLAAYPFCIGNDCQHPPYDAEMCWHVAPDAYAWPGGYPIVYYAAPDYRPQGEVECVELCSICAGKARDQGRRIVSDIFYEGPSVECADCGTEIESAYGDPWDQDDFEGHVG